MPRAEAAIELDVERPVAGGRMLARHDGRVVLVAGAIPGERVRAVVTRRSGQVGFAETREVLTPSADRREAFVDPLCGGATYSHIRYERQLALKAEVVADAFRRIARHTRDQPVPVHPSPETGYRVRARLHVEGQRVGFYREGTHVVCDAALAGQLRPEALDSVVRLRDWLGDGFAACASLVVSENVAGTARVVLCELHPSASPDRFIGMPAIEGLSGVAVQTSGGLFTCVGCDRLIDTRADLLGDDDVLPASVQWQRQAGSFFQANRFLAGPLLKRVLASAIGDRFVDLYSGVGLFAVALAARGARGLAVEGDPASGQDLAENSAPWRVSSGAEPSAGIETRRASVEETVAVPPPWQPDVVVVDPPRTGLSSGVCTGLLAWRVPRLVYVSCDVPTLARDVGRWIAAGYRLTSIEALDMFPNTPHVECVVVLDR